MWLMQWRHWKGELESFLEAVSKEPRSFEEFIESLRQEEDGEAQSMIQASRPCSMMRPPRRVSL